MSWLTDLAGKAEDLLNQIDQGAAQLTTQTPGGGSRAGTPRRQSSYSSPYEHSIDLSAVDQSTPQSATPQLKREHKSSGYASSVSSMREDERRQRSQAKEQEEKLMAYLNEPQQDRPVSSAMSMSRRSSSSSLRSLPTQAFNPLAALSAPPEPNPTPADQSTTSGYTFTTRLERQVAELQAREGDLQKALQAKDSQLAVLRVRLNETEQLLRDRTDKLEATKLEKERLLRDSADSTEVRNQALESVQKQLIESETLLEREKDNLKRTETEYLSRIQKLQEEVSTLSQELTSVQKTITEEKLRSKDAVDQLRLAKYNLEANKHEFDEYKQKAQKILQSKEKLITTLKDGAGIGSDYEQSALAVQLEEIRSERDILKEDLQQNQLQVYNLKTEIQDLESQLAAEQRSGLEQQRGLQEQCQLYQQSSSQYREQVDQLKMEYQYMQDELRRQQLSLQGKLQEKDAEIARLMNQSASRSLNVTSNGELEQRIKHLTENLIQKQTLIESLQTERNSLSLQLERLDRMYREAESAALRATSTAIPIEDSTLSSRIPTFLKETPYDTGVARGVKRAYSTMDSLSVKLGVFLRRYPVARVMVFLYMVLLHVWVMIVLLTYTPEIHTPDFHTNGPPGAGSHI